MTIFISILFLDNFCKFKKLAFLGDFLKANSPHQLLDYQNNPLIDLLCYITKMQSKTRLCVNAKKKPMEINKGFLNNHSCQALWRSIGNDYLITTD